jgi:uracil-DNA glycosylase
MRLQRLLSYHLATLSTFSFRRRGTAALLYHSSALMSLKRKDPPPSSPADLKKPKKNADLTSFFGAPKVVPSGGGKPVSLTSGAATVEDLQPVKFDKEKWVSSLKEEQRQLLKLEIDTLDSSWLAVLKDEIVTPGFLDLKRFLQKEIDAKQKIYPPLEDVYSWYVELRGHPQDIGQTDNPFAGPATALSTKPAW